MPVDSSHSQDNALGEPHGQSQGGPQMQSEGDPTGHSQNQKGTGTGAVLGAGKLVDGCCELTFADPAVRLSVRSFAISEALDQPYEVVVVAAAFDPYLDCSRLVGLAASFRLATGLLERPWRLWSGVVRELAQLSDEVTGLSLYELRIAPFFWRLSERRTRRIFQHLSAIGIAKLVLAEWGIEPSVSLDTEPLPLSEFRVQLDESDFAFVCRQLEEAGLSYWFEQTAPRGEGEAPAQTLVLGVAPRSRRSRFTAPLVYRGTSDAVGREPYVRDLRIVEGMRPGRVVLGGHDYWASRDLRVAAVASVQSEREQKHELYEFAPKAFVVEGYASGATPGAGAPNAAAPSPGGARLVPEAGERAARIALERARTGKRRVTFRTNVLELEPGAVFTLDGHPRAELTHPNRLMVTGAKLSGELNGEWSIFIEATPAVDPYRSALVTPKPRAPGLESAIVVGRAVDEIHTDELGRVKVRFPWDREGKYDDTASCWMRVSQSWAGPGYGLVSVPRVGHEVLVGFLDADPDRPVVVGRLFDRTATLPHALPQHKSRSAWRSSSTPGGGGYNEIGFEDKVGEESVFLRAERNFETTVLGDELAAVGKNLSVSVRGNERHAVGGDQRVVVSGSHSTEAEAGLALHSKRALSVRAGEQAGVSFVGNKLVITNGEASIVLDGPTVRIDAGGNIWLRSSRLVAIQAPHVHIDDDVQIDKHDLVPPKVEVLGPLPSGDSQAMPGKGAPPGGNKPGNSPGMQKPGGMNEAKFDAHKFYEELLLQAGIKVKLPKNIPLPPEINAQLEHIAKVSHKTGVVTKKLLDPATYKAMKDRLDRRLEAEKARLEKLGTDVSEI
ncbi:MAG: type VI secretion system tip protein VgrG, partial [Myxococcales bacterium]|nr:type VI secretion system tip protein VgrG [Myxococcales bacterium]